MIDNNACLQHRFYPVHSWKYCQELYLVDCSKIEIDLANIIQFNKDSSKQNKP